MPNEYVPLVAILIWGSIMFAIGMWATHKPKHPEKNTSTSVPGSHSTSSE